MLWHTSEFFSYLQNIPILKLQKIPWVLFRVLPTCFAPMASLPLMLYLCSEDIYPFMGRIFFPLRIPPIFPYQNVPPTRLGMDRISAVFLSGIRPGRYNVYPETGFPMPYNRPYIRPDIRFPTEFTARYSVFGHFKFSIRPLPGIRSSIKATYPANWISGQSLTPAQ